MSIGGTSSTSSTLNPSYILDNSKNTATESVVGSGLVDTSSLRQIKTDMGKDEFLQILIAQLANQDPMEPMKDTDFIAQMAQFSSLEQMQAMNATFQTGQAYNYVGKTVVATTTIQDESGNWVQTDLTGVVSGIEFKNDTPYLIVGEYLIPMESVSQVYQSSNLDSSILQGGALVGKYVTASKAAADGSMTEISGEVTKVLVKNGRVYAQIDGKEELPVANITAIDDDPITGSNDDVESENAGSEATDNVETTETEQA